MHKNPIFMKSYLDWDLFYPSLIGRWNYWSKTPLGTPGVSSISASYCLPFMWALNFFLLLACALSLPYPPATDCVADFLRMEHSAALFSSSAPLLSHFHFPLASRTTFPAFHVHPARNVLSENSSIEGLNLSYSITTREGKILPILNNCSLSIPSGQFWMLLGPNGCGKSTLLKVLAGLLNPTLGSSHVKKPGSFVFQNPDHQVVMPTVEADVAFGLGNFNLTQDEIRTRVAKALDAVGMYNYSRRPIQTLSGGQKQRVAIAGALAEACQVLLLDELTTFLDETDQEGVVKAVKNCVDNFKVTALWVTHRLEELKHADGAVYMEDGEVVMHGDPLDIMNFIEERKASYIEQINS